MDRELLIGAQALQPKDDAVLRALVRLLGGSMGQRLRFGDQAADCHIVFAPPGAGAGLPGVLVQVLDGHGAVAADPGAIAVTAPLRMSNVMAALHEAIARSRPERAQADPAAGLTALFDRLQRCMGQGLPLRSVIPLHSGHLLLIDAQRLQLQTTAPLDQLLSGDCQPDAWRPAGRVDEELLFSAPTHPLRDFVWRLTHRLVEAGATPPPLSGSWRLRRWPEAVGLMTPGHPRLAALLTADRHTVAGLSAASGRPAAAVQWFILSCQLFGLAEQIDTGPVAVAAPGVPARPGAAPSWLGQLRERLRLW